MNTVVQNLVLYELSAILLGAGLLMAKTAFDRSRKGPASRSGGDGKRRESLPGAGRENRGGSAKDESRS